MIKGNRIYIVGFMGAGKSFTARKLANIIGWSCLDLDHEIELYAGKKIPQIFAEDGEAEFREIESVVLKNLRNMGNMVVSTGGGTPCFYDNMDFMLDSGYVAYLKMTPSQLRSRLAVSKKERPLLTGVSYDDMLDVIDEKLKERSKWYERADIIVDGLNGPYKKIAELFIDMRNSLK